MMCFVLVVVLLVVVVALGGGEGISVGTPSIEHTG